MKGRAQTALRQFQSSTSALITPSLPSLPFSLYTRPYIAHTYPYYQLHPHQTPSRPSLPLSSSPPSSFANSRSVLGPSREPYSATYSMHLYSFHLHPASRRPPHMEIRALARHFTKELSPLANLLVSGHGRKAAPLVSRGPVLAFPLNQRINYRSTALVYGLQLITKKGISPLQSDASARAERRVPGVWRRAMCSHLQVGLLTAPTMTKEQGQLCAGR